MCHLQTPIQKETGHVHFESRIRDGHAQYF